MTHDLFTGNFVKKEKPSLFDSFRRKVKKLSEAKPTKDDSPLASPTPKAVEIDYNGGYLLDFSTEAFEYGK